MHGKSLILLTVLTAVFVLQGCTTQTSESNVAKNTETNQPVQISNTQNVNADISNAETSNVSVPNANLALSGNKGKMTKIPEPKIGSGGNDLAIIVKARGQLSSDKDLINNVIVEVKEGNVTLTGKVANEDQKRKAEELIKGVDGVKSVKNNLRVAP